MAFARGEALDDVRRRTPQRRVQKPWWRSLAEGAVMLLLLAAIMFVAREGGWLAEETGSFTAVDGDSLRKDGKDYRLHAIDAPELFQTCWRADGREYQCGHAARDELRRLVRSATVTCQVLDTDRYGRSVAECKAGEVNLNEAMVRAGWAVAYTRHGQDHAAAQDEARAAKRGIWQGRFQTPEAWRNANRNGLMQAEAD